MNYIHSIKLKDIVFFKGEHEFVFRKGLTFIKGRNLHRKVGRTSNGAGKSLLFGVIPNVLFDTHSVIVKNTRSVQKQIYGKGSEVELAFSPASDPKAKYLYRKAGSSVFMEKDGHDLDTRVGRDHLRTLIPLTEQEFFSTVYLDSRRPDSFLMGTSSERYSFLTELFRLKLDEFRKHIDGQLSTLKGDARLLDDLYSQLEEAKAELASIPKGVAEKAASIKAKIQQQSLQAQEWTALILQGEQYTKYQEALAAVTKAPRPEMDTATIQKALKAWSVYEHASKAYKTALARRQEIEQQCQELGVTKEQASRYDDMVRLQSKVSNIVKPEKPSSDLAPAKELAHKRTKQQAQEQLHKARALQKIRQADLDSFCKHLGDGHKCPTCFNHLSEDGKESIQQHLKNSIAKCAKVVKAMERILAAHAILDDWAEYREQAAAYSAVKDDLATVAAYPFNKVNKWRKLQPALQEALPDKPEAPSIAENVLQEYAKQAATFQRLRDTADILRVEKPTQKVSRKDLAELNKQVGEAMQSLPKFEAQAAKRKAALRQCKQLSAKIAELQEGLDDYPIYQLLASAYSSNKGLKTLIIQRIAKALERNMNRLSRQVFAEDFSFTFQVEEGKFDIFVTRRIGTTFASSDVRHLSGAESRLFIMLRLLALLPLLPASRRVNILVLDEPDTNLDDPALEVFAKELLPRLGKIVPSVVVISPRDYSTEGAHVYTVVKEKGAARIVAGEVK